MTMTISPGDIALGAMAALMMCGCLSQKLLEDRTERAPALDPKVELRLRTQGEADVLVIYTEQIKSTGETNRRGFYLFANEAKLRKGKPPTFVKPGYIGRHVNLPIYKSRPDDPGAIAGDLYAVLHSPWKFALESRGQTLTECQLPEYGNWWTAKKVLLFPLAAGVDAVGVGAVAGAVVGWAEVQNGVSFTFP